MTCVCDDTETGLFHWEMKLVFVKNMKWLHVSCSSTDTNASWLHNIWSDNYLIRYCNDASFYWDISVDENLITYCIFRYTALRILKNKGHFVFHTIFFWLKCKYTVDVYRNVQVMSQYEVHLISEAFTQCKSSLLPKSCVNTTALLVTN